MSEKLNSYLNLPEAIIMQYDMVILYNVIKITKPDNILELGTGGGLSTRIFALAGSEISSGSEIQTKIVSVDIDAERQKNISEIIKKEGFNNVTFATEDSISFLRRNCQGVCDFIFIDTDHTYKQTLAEILLTTSLISNKGYVFMHDTRYPEVWDAIQTFLRSNCSFNFIDYCTPAGLGLIIKKTGDMWIPVRT